MIVALDIDGTLGDHYSHFIRFAQMWLGREVTYEPINGWPPGSTRFQFNRSLGISKDQYRKIKLAYRLGGMKRSMPVFEGAPEITLGLRKLGVDIWICTSRPYLRMDTIDPDTRHWLRINHIKYNHTIYGDYKYRELSKIVSYTDVVCVLDDLPEMCKQAVTYGMFPILIERPHNVNRPKDNYSTVNGLWEAEFVIERLIHERSN